MVNERFESFVMRSVRTQKYARTLSEAFRDADYGTAIWRCEKPSSEPWKYHAFIEAIVLLGTMFMLGVLLAPYIS